MPTEKVYVQLLREGTDTWRPTLGERLGPATYRLLPTPNYDPDDEVWEFLPGTLVECEERTLSAGRVLVAVRRVNVPPRRGEASPPQ